MKEEDVVVLLKSFRGIRSTKERCIVEGTRFF